MNQGPQPTARRLSDPAADSHRLCVAPMMDWTDRHCRYFHRLLAPRARLYTEMVTAPAVVFGDREKLLCFHPAEHPVALQLGGSDPEQLAQAARIGEDYGYDEINLNVGCPSDRVQSGRFGACLMREPELVAECVAAMREAVAIEVTVKHRLGVDDQDTEESLDRFVDTVASAGCNLFLVHARKAWLSGLSPKENRDVPPLDYERVERLAVDHPELRFVLNGGVVDTQTAINAGQHLAGIMLGRAAYQKPYILAETHALLFGQPAAPASDYLHQLLPYLREHLAAGGMLKHVSRHLLGLFAGQPGARGWRRTISEGAHLPGASESLLLDALSHVNR